MKFDRNAQAVVSADAVFAREYKQLGRIQAPLQQFRKRIADPRDSWSLGLIFKRNHQHVQASVGRCLREGTSGEEQDCAEPEKVQDNRL